MAKIVVTTNMSLDGVVQDPDGQEAFDRGAWFNQFGAQDLGAWAEFEAEEAMKAAGMLLGRRSDEWFASRWSARAGDWADRLNALPKHVVSTTLTEARWQNSTVLAGDPIAEVTKLKQRATGEILVYASYQLVRALIDHDLVDELRLVVFPVVVGAGERLFGTTAEAKALKLKGTQRIGESLLFVSYELGAQVAAG